MPVWSPVRDKLLENATPAMMPASALSALERFLFVNPLRKIYSRVRQEGGSGILEGLLHEMRIEVRVAPQDLARIPRSGPALVVANHPFGILDGVVLGALLSRTRKDVKILTNYLVAAVEELRDVCIYLDPFGRASSRHANVPGLRRAVAHLKSGGLLVMFPAGEVSHWQLRHGEVTDPEWSATGARLVRLTRAPVLPVLFTGRNSLRYQVLGVIHPKLRTIQLPYEFLNKAGKKIGLRVGTLVPAEKLGRIHNDQQAANYLRWRTYLLRRREPAAQVALRAASQTAGRLEPLAPSADREAIAAEIESLCVENELDESRDFRVLVADAAQIPCTMFEIGRQRELAFRDAGEGTGKEVDLDRFDAHYKHLILWHKKDMQVAGAYRFANTQEVLATRGLRGLYTSTLFWIDPTLFECTGPVLELGRSFIRREYQKQYAALLMLWKGIARYLVRHPETAVLFGPVSISSTYNRTSRELLFQFFQSQRGSPLSQWIRPKRAFRSRPLPDWQLRAIRYLLDLEEMSSSISEIEGDGKGVPVLMRQYLKLGGELLAFNVDKNFSDVLDGLILVDLRRTDPARLEAYMGKDGVASFLNHHASAEQSLVIA